MIHVAHLDWHPERYWFASLDGQSWLEVNQEPGPEDEADVRELFRPTRTADGGMTHRLTFARWWLQQRNAVFH